MLYFITSVLIHCNYSSRYNKHSYINNITLYIITVLVSLISSHNTLYTLCLHYTEGGDNHLFVHSFIYTDLGFSGSFTRDQKTLRQIPESRTSTQVSSHLITPCGYRSFRREPARRPRFSSSCRRCAERDDDSSCS